MFSERISYSIMVVKFANIKEKIQFMADHALIGKFIGLQPSEKDLIWWINSTWKPKGHYDLHLGSKGFLLFPLSVKKIGIALLMVVHISIILRVFSFVLGKRNFVQKRKI